MRASFVGCGYLVGRASAASGRAVASAGVVPSMAASSADIDKEEAPHLSAVHWVRSQRGGLALSARSLSLERPAAVNF